MKLLLDENLSRNIVPALQEAFLGTTQVALVGLERASDRAVWEFAKAGEFTIVTKDDDFLGLLSLLGYPPKIVLLTLGNCTNRQIKLMPWCDQEKKLKPLWRMMKLA